MSSGDTQSSGPGWASEGLDLTNLDSISDAEIDANLMYVWRWRGPTYEFTAKSLMLDYAPDFAKVHRAGADLFGRPKIENIILLSIHNIHSYVLVGWETGILNEFLTLLRHGIAVERTMELVMFAQLYAGIRGIGHVVRAVGDTLPSLEAPAAEFTGWPDGWSTDPESIRCGLDLSTPEMTPDDRERLTSWWTDAIGHVPRSVAVGLKYHPDFIKINRAKWESAIKTLPKQVIPWQMIRHNVVTASVDGIREAVLLARHWGISRQLVIHGLIATSYYHTGVEGLYAVHQAVEDVLDAWE